MEKIQYDPTDYQIDSYGKYDMADMDISEMANEQSVKMLLQQNFVNLHDLKATKTELVNAKGRVDELQSVRENLRVQLATSNLNAGVDIASIFMSLLGGFAINMITINGKDPLGWVIFIICISTVITFKASSVISLLNSIKSKTEGDL